MKWRLQMNQTRWTRRGQDRFSSPDDDKEEDFNGNDLSVTCQFGMNDDIWEITVCLQHVGTGAAGESTAWRERSTFTRRRFFILFTVKFELAS